jgi:hypothetical protein
VAVPVVTTITTMADTQRQLSRRRVVPLHLKRSHSKIRRQHKAHRQLVVSMILMMIFRSRQQYM